MDDQQSYQLSFALSEVLEYEELLEKGMELIRKFSGDQWTDHNVHDPGITILEQLCYALTDLSYRAGFPIPDLMAGEGMTTWPEAYHPGLLASGPITLRDWRKVLIDTPGVRNAWIYTVDTTSEEYDARVYYNAAEEALSMSVPLVNRDAKRTLEPVALQGLYRVVFLAEPGQNPELTGNNIRRRLGALRNLCEDFHQIENLATRAVKVEARIEIESVSDPADLLARIYFEIQEYLSPRIRFYTLQDRRETGLETEDIFEGPLLDHGFLDDDELDAFQTRRSVRVSDVLRLIMAQDGVRSVQSLRLSIPGTSIAASTQNHEPWELIVPDGLAPVLLLPSASGKAVPEVGVEFWKNGLPLRIEWEVTSEKIQALNQIALERTRPQRQSMADWSPEAGVDREIALNQSLQHQFPEVYGIGEIGLAPPHDDRRLAQARQLKAYLSIFDQLLANAFAQLGGVRQLFSLNTGSSAVTYFSQSMWGETPDLEPLIHWEAMGMRRGHAREERELEYKAQLQVFAEGGELDPGTRGSLRATGKQVYEKGGSRKEAQQDLWHRRNRLLNHLLARFGEELNEHDAVLKDKLFRYKESLLKEYIHLGKRRGTAFDYHAATPPDSAGLGQRISLLLGFSLPEVEQRSLGALPADNPGAFHLIEHILLRPRPGEEINKSPIVKIPAPAGDRPLFKDPFSLQMSFIFPAWLDRFDEQKNPGFRDTVIKLIREETPAHLRIYVYWLDQAAMQLFEVSYFKWLNQLQAR